LSDDDRMILKYLGVDSGISAIRNETEFFEYDNFDMFAPFVTGIDTP
jgi:hypothetical protein